MVKNLILGRLVFGGRSAKPNNALAFGLLIGLLMTVNIGYAQSVLPKVKQLIESRQDAKVLIVGDRGEDCAESGIRNVLGSFETSQGGDSRWQNICRRRQRSNGSVHERSSGLHQATVGRCSIAIRCRRIFPELYFVRKPIVNVMVRADGAQSAC